MGSASFFDENGYRWSPIFIDTGEQNCCHCNAKINGRGFKRMDSKKSILFCSQCSLKIKRFRGTLDNLKGLGKKNRIRGNWSE